MDERAELIERAKAWMANPPFTVHGKTGLLFRDLLAAIQSQPAASQSAEPVCKHGFPAARCAQCERDVAPPQQAQTQGEWVMVPREPTEEIINAICKSGRIVPERAYWIYKDALAAAPQPPAKGGGK